MPVDAPNWLSRVPGCEHSMASSCCWRTHRRCRKAGTALGHGPGHRISCPGKLSELHEHKVPVFLGETQRSSWRVHPKPGLSRKRLITPRDGSAPRQEPWGSLRHRDRAAPRAISGSEGRHCVPGSHYTNLCVLLSAQPAVHGLLC